MRDYNCEYCGMPIRSRMDLIVSKAHYLSVPKPYHYECFVEQMSDIKAFYNQVEPINSVLYSLRISMLLAVYLFLFSVRVQSAMYMTFFVVAGGILALECFSRVYSFFTYEWHLPTKKQMRI